MNTTRNTTKAYVVEASPSEITVKVIDDGVIDLLVALGFVPTPDKEQKVMSLVTLNQRSKIIVFEKLRDAGVCFSAGPGWCPADVFEFLRENKMLSGPYRRIVWRGPGESQIIENS
ncbi:hypothetical protein ACQKEN_20605 [Pseudomonas sp. NPDC078416]|uniref:hypothetical protein n=1 Tax=Pseudomonas sp. NPDC078416 TaxID=3390637 RepID=UPI003D05FCF6